MVTEADFQRRLPRQAASRSQCRVPRTTGCNILSACGSTAQSSDSASSLELGTYNHCRETYVLDVNEWDETTWLTYTIDDYRRLRPMTAVEAPIDAKSLAEALPPRRIPTMTYTEMHELRVRYWMAGRMLYEFGSGNKEELRSETRERRKWVNSFGTQDWRKVINWAFLSSVSSLLYSSPYLITSLDLGPV